MPWAWAQETSWMLSPMISTSSGRKRRPHRPLGAVERHRRQLRAVDAVAAEGAEREEAG